MPFYWAPANCHLIFTSPFGGRSAHSHVIDKKTKVKWHAPTLCTQQISEQTSQDPISGFSVPFHCFLLLPESNTGCGKSYKKGRSDGFLLGDEDKKASETIPMIPHFPTDNEVIMLKPSPARPQPVELWPGQPSLSLPVTHLLSNVDVAQHCWRPPGFSQFATTLYFSLL